MKKILYIHKFLIAFVLLQNMCFADANDVINTIPGLSAEDKESARSIAPIIERNIVPIKFYGKVVDQDNNPVEGAEVLIGVQKIDLRTYITNQGGTEEHKIMTDKKGLFDCSDRGQGLWVKNIQKDSYEFMEEWNQQRDFEYNTRNRFIPDKNKPVVFKLRKRNQLAFLMKSEGGLLLRRDMNDVHKERKFDLQTTSYIDSNYVQQEEKHYDMKVEIDYIQEDSVYEVNIITLDPNSGLILSDDLLYEAPESGYQPQIFLEYTQSKPKQQLIEIQKYLYIKSRTKPIYSRAKLWIKRSDQDASVIIEAFTNPTGSRSLEYEQEWNTKENTRRWQEREKKDKLKWEQEQKEWKKLEKERKKQSK